MAHAKPILAVSSFGLGAALLLLAAQIQRDPFAFTAQPAKSDEALTAVNVLPPEPAAFLEEIPVVPVEALELLPAPAAVPRARKPAAPSKEVEPPEPAQPPCNPEWRELESGPAGRMVREICAPQNPGEVPRS